MYQCWPFVSETFPAIGIRPISLATTLDDLTSMTKLFENGEFMTIFE